MAAIATTAAVIALAVLLDLHFIAVVGVVVVVVPDRFVKKKEKEIGIDKVP